MVRALLIALLMLATSFAKAQFVSNDDFNTDSLRFEALRGSGKAALLMSEFWQFGHYGLKINADSSRTFLRLAARYGDPDAEYILGSAYVRGAGYRRDLLRGVTLLEKAAEKNNLLALGLLWELYSDTTKNVFVQPGERVAADPGRAFLYAMRAAKLKDTQSQLYVGKAFHKAVGVVRNDTLALAWLDSASQRGNAQAQLLLGDLYLSGRTHHQVNLEKAKYYYQLALDNKYAQVEETTAAKYGLLAVDQYPRQLYNLCARTYFLVPPGALELAVKH